MITGQINVGFMETIVIASNNKNKIEQMKQIMPEYNLLTMSDIGFNDDIVEDGETFLENALIKANTVRDFLLLNNLNYPIIAEDSGLCVNALSGEPGIYSARYAGGHGDNKACRQKLLEKLKNKEDRTAYYYAIAVLMEIDGSYKIGEGKVEGVILKKEAKENNFGYDPLFYSNELNKELKTPTSFNSIQELKYYIRDRNPLISMAAL